MKFKKGLIFIIIILILSIGIYYFALFLCKVEVKCKNCPKVSESRGNSIQNKLFIDDYDFDKDTINLKKWNQKIIIDSIWIEKKWIINSDNCFSKKIEQQKGYNLIINFKDNTEEFLFNFRTENKLDNENSSGIGLNRKVFRFNSIPKELKILIEERNPIETIGWQKSIITDTITIKAKQ